METETFSLLVQSACIERNIIVTFNAAKAGLRQADAGLPRGGPTKFNKNNILYIFYSALPPTYVHLASPLQLVIPV